ncbi:TetR/AcrR family transcriptional regulator [Amycolatopsis suaedae]|uniref:TetR/AcrR family transcriptional regulator n=1 Tax=Amycolatopsis suaedae TaxID=2510978 RepID=A0A4Q7J8F1_9PSEU|nr:TetR/AcrR family transcriptional regulator [Amycolatopsis suaedae]RZQ63487.1 TetR/AcrR family transcriptional regulator [Amycolatopsis suaedae]
MDVSRRQTGGAPVRERADAARNRERILAAAGRLFAERGIEAVSMDQIASAAGVGKGTLFRRFGDKAGMAAELLGRRELSLQEAVRSGQPPLGPGAPPGERLDAFLCAYLRFLEQHLDLVHLSDTAAPGARYRFGGYWFWHRHVAALLGQARPEVDADYLAHVLLGPLAAEQRRALAGEYAAERVLAGLRTMLKLVLTGKPQ